MSETSSIPSTTPTADASQIVSMEVPPAVPPALRKGTKNSILLITVGLVVALVACNLVWGYVKVQDDARYDSLNSDLAELQQNQTSLESSYDDLQSSYNDLQMNYNAIDQSYWVLQRENLIYETYRLESTVADYYETVRDSNSMQTSDWWYSWLSTQDKVNFCANLAKHDIGKIYWASIETAYHDYYGTYSYDDAKARLEYFLNLAEVQPDYKPEVKIDRILKSITDNIAYRPDMNDRYNSPWETLAYQSGDCDDFSTLASALFELAGVDSAIEFVKNSANDGHAMVLVHLDDLGPYGYYYYSDLTSYGLAAGNWIVIEPQMTIDQQHDSTWMSQWSIIAAADV